MCSDTDKEHINAQNRRDTLTHVNAQKRRVNTQKRHINTHAKGVKKTC